MKFSKINSKKRIFKRLKSGKKRSLSFKIAGILAIFLVAGVFLFGGKAQRLASSKIDGEGKLLLQRRGV